MPSRTFDLIGADRLIDALARGGSKAIPAIGRALYEEGQNIFRESQKQVPHDEGVLMASGQLHMPAVSGSSVLVEITYGGSAATYAEIQHENEDYKHDEGRKAKYLEDPFMDAIPGLDNAIADRIEAIMRGLI